MRTRTWLLESLDRGMEGCSVAGIERDSGIGKVALSEEVVATIAGVAATECYGIVGMASRKVSDGLAELLGRENLARGVDVSLEDAEVSITINVIVSYGTRIPEVARNVIEKVKYSVESSTGLRVCRVHVHVQGIRVNPS